jgi:hypothetical protein
MLLSMLRPASILLRLQNQLFFFSLPDEGGHDGGGSDSLYAVIYDIVSAGSDEIPEYTVELVVLRGVAQSSEHSGALYEWASEVVAHACHDRRNVRVCSACIYFYIPYPLL